MMDALLAEGLYTDAAAACRAAGAPPRWPGHRLPPVGRPGPGGVSIQQDGEKPYWHFFGEALIPPPQWGGCYSCGVPQRGVASFLCGTKSLFRLKHLSSSHLFHPLWYMTWGEVLEEGEGIGGGVSSVSATCSLCLACPPYCPACAQAPLSPQSTSTGLCTL